MRLLICLFVISSSLLAQADTKIGFSGSTLLPADALVWFDKGWEGIDEGGTALRLEPSKEQRVQIDPSQDVTFTIFPFIYRADLDYVEYRIETYFEGGKLRLRLIEIKEEEKP